MAHSEDPKSRRELLGWAASGLIATATAAIPAANAFRTSQPLPAGEDLMQEHGVFGRLLLAYEEIARRLRTNQKGNIEECLRNSTALIVNNVQDHHERIEELMIFPVLTKANTHAALVSTLVEQHKAGRTITDALTKATAGGALDTRSKRDHVAKLLTSFTRMFRPHALREDTVVYPALRQILNEEQYAELSEKVRQLENKMTANPDLSDVVRQLESIETALGINDLSRYTAEV